jgi:putative Mn2+ efflux pump MntP
MILAYVLTALAWTLAATALCVGRFVAVIAGESAFIGGIVLCILGFGHIGAPLGVVGFVASRLAA